MKRWLCASLALLFYASILPWAGADYFNQRAHDLTSDGGNISGFDNVTNTGYGGTSRTGDLIVKNSPYVDVRAYGAVCDGVTDDSAAIQAVLASMEATGGGNIVIPGQCAIGSTLTYDGVPLQRWLTITGMGTHPGLKWIGPAGGVMFQDNLVQSKAKLHINNLEFTSSVGTIAGRAGIALNFQNLNESIIENCTFMAVTDAIVWKFGLLNIIRHNRFHGPIRDAIRFDVGDQSNGNLIELNEFAWNERWAINYLAYSNGSIIRDNDFEGDANSTPPSPGSINAPSFVTGTIQDNRFEEISVDNTFRSITIGGYWVNVRGNMIGLGGVVGFCGIEVKGDADLIFFYGNSVQEVASGGSGLCINSNAQPNLIASYGDQFAAGAGGGTRIGGTFASRVREFASSYGLDISTPYFKVYNDSGGTNPTGTGGIVLHNKNITWQTYPPDSPSYTEAAGTWGAGDIVLNSYHAEGPGLPSDPTMFPLLWYATAAGSPGTWAPVYQIFTSAPASSAAYGKPGMVSVDNNYIYWVSPTDNTWRRAAGAGW